MELELVSVVYLGAGLAFGRAVLKPGTAGSSLGVPLLAAGLAIHAWAVTMASVRLGVLPVTSFEQGLSFLACLLAASALLVYWRYGLPVVGAIISPLAFLLTVAAAALAPVDPDVPAQLKSPWLPVHVTLAFLGHTVFAVAAATSLVYLAQEGLLKSHRHGAMIRRLPSLEELDRLSFRCLAWGLPLLTLGILSGGIWASAAWGRFWSWEPREVLSLVTWLIYAALLRSRLAGGLRGRRAAGLTLLGFAILLASYLSVNLFPLPGRHGGGFGS